MQLRNSNAETNIGGIAQLGERLHGMQEVSGSIPLTSTIRPSGQAGSAWQGVKTDFDPIV